MLATKNKINLLHTLILFTTLFVCTQILFVGINLHVNGLLSTINNILTINLLFSKAIFFPGLQFFVSQFLIYSFYIYIIWYLTISITELFSLPLIVSQLICIFLWLNSTIAVLFLNAYYVPHSTFTTMLQHNLLNDALTTHQIKIILWITLGVLSIAGFLTLIQMLRNVSKKQRLLRNTLAFIFIGVLFFIINGLPFFKHTIINTRGTAQTPNIILISFDAMRPDYLTFFDGTHLPTPHFDAFLNSSTLFVNAYTPIARTSPSWAGILTSRYPIHNGVRENNVADDPAYLNFTLPKLLQKIGYETVYATDDRQFNIIDKNFGFDHIIGPRGSIADILINVLNDFPLSNLLVPTPLGKLLFPYNYANHAAPFTYDPNNFLDVINDALKQSSNKPLFLAVHFDVSAWPFFWHNDKLAYNASEVEAYANSIKGNDLLFSHFLNLLQQNKLLDHAIVVVLSDHGITLSLHHDRATAKEFYQGDKEHMKVLRAHYADAEKIIINPKNVSLQKNSLHLKLDTQTFSFNSNKDFGVDTSYGYGGDILSLKQNQPLLAIRGYGIDLGKPHRVSGPALLLDIAPTLLDVLHFPALAESDGVSLKPYLYNSHLAISDERPIYLESCFSIGEIEHQDINVAAVVKKNINHYELNAATGTYHLNPIYYKDTLLSSRQRAILQKDWLLAYYPASERFLIIRTATGVRLQNVILPAYFVLLNLKTHEWTTEINNPLISHSPMVLLKQNLDKFYGHEMDIYIKK